MCLEQKVALITLVPRTCAVRQALEAWGQQQPALPLLLEKPGRTKAEAPRRWHGQSVIRQVEVEYSDGRVALETLRFVVVHSSQLAPQQTQAYTPPRKPRKPMPSLRLASPCKPAGLPVRRMPQRLARSMRAGDQDNEVAAHVPGGIMRYAIASWLRRAARVGLDGDGQPRRSHHRPKRAIAWWWR